MLHGCDVLGGGTELQALVTGADYLPNATFTQQVVGALTLTTYIGHAVSVQTSSGSMLGCGRLETLFPVDASYQDINTFSQNSPYFPVSFVDASLLNILQYNILEGSASTCSRKSSIFDPWSPPGPQPGPETTSDQFPVGDLANHNLEAFSVLHEVPLIGPGSTSILGHVVCKGLGRIICFCSCCASIKH